MKTALGVIAAVYLMIGSLHSMLFGFVIPPKACGDARGLVYVYCNYGTDISYFVISVAWPWYWLGRTETHAQHLTGTDRSDFIAGTIDSCMRNYGKGNTSVIPRPLFEKYCQCYAGDLVDNLTSEQLKDADAPASNAEIQVAGKRCYQNDKR